jgi:hypothetical protein
MSLGLPAAARSSQSRHAHALVNTAYNIAATQKPWEPVPAARALAQPPMGLVGRSLRSCSHKMGPALPRIGHEVCLVHVPDCAST